MNMKQLFSLALLVSAFAVAPSFAMDAPDANPQPAQPAQQDPQPAQQDPQPAGPRCPFAKLAEYPIFSEIHGLHHPSAIPGNYYNFVKGLLWNNPIKSGITFVIAKTIYDNVDNIKAALGLGQDDADADAQVFADAKCGCTDAQAEEEEAEAVEVCELDKRDAKKANA